MLVFGSTPDFMYSAMNGYGHYAWPVTIMNAYWMAFVAVFLVVCHLLWVRGTSGLE